MTSSHVFHRSLRSDPPKAVGGKGIWLTDQYGNDYIDASGGAAVSCLGHGDEDVIRAIKRQLDQLEFAHTAFLSSGPAEALSDFLAEAAPQELTRACFVSGGSEAVETALKIARQFWVEAGFQTKSKFIARRQSYHGNTLGALAVGGNEWRKEMFRPLLIDHPRVSPCYAYRDQSEDETEQDYARRLVNELEELIEREGAETIIAFVAETVSGATLGTACAPDGYFKGVREVCDRYNILLILDEVMCGSGRTGSLFAFEQEGIVPDLVTMAKGLGAGYQPIGALMISDRIYQTLKDGSGAHVGGHTYLGHPLACAAALAVQTAIRDRGLLNHVKSRGERLRQALVSRFGQHAFVGDIRGRGLFQSIELVADRSTKEVFDPALKLNARIKKEAMARGLICYPNGGTIDGQRGDHVLLAPPFISEPSDIDEIVVRLGEAVDAAIDGCRSS